MGMTAKNNNFILKPLISVVMPVYGVEDYLRDAIESVVNQSIGFEDNIELILVNDGSPDKSGDICEEYAKKYPNNIKYIKQKNQGLSATRRNGFIEARGEYVHSMDSDDTISLNYYDGVVKFFDKHKDEVDFVSSKLVLFEARSGGHYANYRFKHTRVISIDDEPTSLQYHIASTVIKRDALKIEWFDEKISIGEDARLLAILVRCKRAYGVVSDITYNYRIRESGGSLINTQHQKLDYYTETPYRFWKYILDLWEDKDGSIPPYIQNYILHDVQWRINEQKRQSILTKTQEDRYKKIVYETISRLDDSIIMSQPRLAAYKKISLLKKKYKEDFDSYIRLDEGYKLNTEVLVSESEYDTYFGLVFEFIDKVNQDEYMIEGHPVNDLLHSGDKYVIETSYGEFGVIYTKRDHRSKDSFLGDKFRQLEGFKAKVKCNNIDNIRVKVVTFDGRSFYVPIHTKRHTKISDLGLSYKVHEGSIIRKSKGYISLHPYTKSRHFYYEIAFIARIAINIRAGRFLSLVKQSINNIKDNSYNPKPLSVIFLGLIRPSLFIIKTLARNLVSIYIRIAYRINGAFNKKPLWIITDRGVGAGDNGEAFFEYLNSIRVDQVDYVFAVGKKSADYNRLRLTGPVVDMNSFKYKLLFLRSSKLISSQADEYIVNPFADKLHHLLDLYSADFIFLQHGVTKNDISGWLNRFSKNIRLFVTAAKPEYDSIMRYPFYYSKDRVILTGFPRYDLLRSEPQKKIMLAPTWRKYLTSGSADKSGKWEYRDDFKNSDYFKFYNDLINDKRIISTLSKYNAKGEFYLHPSHLSQIKDFQGNNTFKVMKFPYKYRNAFNQSNLLITDYSSVYFDFAYLRKPVIYTQFDRDYYYNNHGVYEEGYFDEARDGFGPVVKTYSETVNAIIDSIENNFMIEDKYKDRIDKFFKYNDNKNSERVFNAILNIENSQRDRL